MKAVTLSRYALLCRLCGARWMEDATHGATLGDSHDCAQLAEARAQAERSGYLPLSLAIERKRVLWSPDPRGYHPCGPRCWSALGTDCHCECRGVKHGILKLPPKELTTEGMEDLYSRLTGPSPHRKGDGPTNLRLTASQYVQAAIKRSKQKKEQHETHQ